MRKDSNRVVYCPDEVQTDTLWRKKDTQQTHFVVIVAHGMVQTRSVEGVFKGTLNEFMEQFEWIMTNQDRDRQYASEIKRRQSGAGVRRNKPKAASRIRYEKRVEAEQ